METGESDQPGINGGIFVPKEPFQGTVNTVEVSDIDAYMEKVGKSGGEVVTENITVPGVGYSAYCKDVEGTLFGIHQPDRTLAQAHLHRDHKFQQKSHLSS